MWVMLLSYPVAVGLVSVFGWPDGEEPRPHFIEKVLANGDRIQMQDDGTCKKLTSGVSEDTFNCMTGESDDVSVEVNCFDYFDEP